MRVFPVSKNGARKVSATVKSPSDISASTPTIALHFDDVTDSFLPATWATTPALVTDATSANYGLYVGVAETSSNVDFSALTLGTYIVRAKAGSAPSVDCYVLKVVP